MSKEYQSAKKLIPFANALTESETLNDGENPHELTFNHAIRLIKIGNLPAAMDGILDILKEDKEFHNGQLKEIFLGIFEILGPNNWMTRQYQAELAAVLFS